MSLSFSKSDKVNIVFSASSFDLFETCECKYNYSHNMRKTLPMIQRPASLDKGLLTHVGLETYFNALAEGIIFNDRLNKALMKIRETASNLDTSNVDMDTDLPLVLSAVEQSCVFWRAEDEMNEVLAVEAPFDYILYEDEFLRIIISGKIDLLTNNPGIGGNSSYTNLPTDHKSFSRSGPTYRMSNQFKNYAAACTSNYLQVNKIGLQKTLTKEEKFKRIILSYDPQILSDWKENVKNVILNRYLTCVKTGIWPMNETSCTKYNTLCEFHDVCDSSGQEAKDYKLADIYIDKEPWDKYEPVD
jgi:hypothetical protein